VNQDIDVVCEGWDFKPGMVQARMVQARDGRQLIQMRVDLGLLQMEIKGRPDGARPHGRLTYLAHLQDQARAARKADRSFVLNEEQCQEADREFVQYYHRRICWLALRQYDQAIADADHTLAFMDFVKRHTPHEEYMQAHEQYRAFVLFQRTQAAAALRVEEGKPETAIDDIRAGLDQIHAFFAEHELEEQFDEDGMVQHLRKVEASLRQEYKIGATLQEQLEQAIAEENYEKAAQLRDQLRRKS
jgi:hypothetical protein